MHPCLFDFDKFGNMASPGCSPAGTPCPEASAFCGYGSPGHGPATGSGCVHRVEPNEGSSGGASDESERGGSADDDGGGARARG